MLNVELTLLSAIPPFAARHFLAHHYPLHSACEENLAAGLVLVDVTEKKHTEEAQKELADLNFLRDVCVLHLVILSYIYGHMGRGEVAQLGTAKSLKKTP